MLPASHSILFSKSGIGVLGRDPGGSFLKQWCKVWGLLYHSEHQITGLGFSAPCQLLCLLSFLCQTEVDEWKGCHHRATRMIRGLEGLTSEIRLKDLNIYHFLSCGCGADRRPIYRYMWCNHLWPLGSAGKGMLAVRRKRSWKGWSVVPFSACWAPECPHPGCLHFRLGSPLHHWPRS